MKMRKARTTVGYTPFRLRPLPPPFRSHSVAPSAIAHSTRTIVSSRLRYLMGYGSQSIDIRVASTICTRCCTCCRYTVALFRHPYPISFFPQAINRGLPWDGMKDEKEIMKKKAMDPNIIFKVPLLTPPFLNPASFAGRPSRVRHNR